MTDPTQAVSPTMSPADRQQAEQAESLLGPHWTVDDTTVLDATTGRRVLLLAGTRIDVDAASWDIDGNVTGWIGGDHVVLSTEFDPDARPPRVLLADHRPDPSDPLQYGFTQQQWDRLPVYARDRIVILARHREEALARSDRARDRYASDAAYAVADPITDNLEIAPNVNGRVVVEFRDGMGGAVHVESWPTREDVTVRTLRVRATRADKLIVVPHDGTSIELEVRSQ